MIMNELIYLEGFDDSIYFIIQKVFRKLIFQNSKRLKKIKRLKKNKKTRHNKELW
jgi:hypothetical protein